MSFWANKLNGTPQKPVVPSRDLFGIYTPRVSPPETVSEETYTPTVRLTQGGNCPGCGSENYRANVGSYAIACPECGYHPRFEQTGYGEGSLRTAGQKAAPAKQIHDEGFSLKGAFAELNAGGGAHMHNQTTEQ